MKLLALDTKAFGYCHSTSEEDLHPFLDGHVRKHQLGTRVDVDVAKIDVVGWHVNRNMGLGISAIGQRELLCQEAEG